MKLEHQEGKTGDECEEVGKRFGHYSQEASEVFCFVGVTSFDNHFKLTENLQQQKRVQRTNTCLSCPLVHLLLTFCPIYLIIVSLTLHREKKWNPGFRMG